MCSQCFFSVSDQLFHLFFDCWKFCMFKRKWNCYRGFSLDEFKWSVGPFSMSSVIMCKLQGAKSFRPVFRVENAVNRQIRFDFLIYSFCRSIGLWVVCC